MDSLGEIAVILVLVLLNGFFAGAEVAILTSRRSRLEQAVRLGDRGAGWALHLLENPNRFLSTVQVGITLVGTLAAAYGGVSLVDDLSQWLADSPVPFAARHARTAALAAVTFSIAFASLILGELVPKRVALSRAESIAGLVGLPMYLLSTVTRPAVAVLTFFTELALRVLRVKPTTGPTVTIEDIQHLIQAGTREGVLETAEQQVAIEALRLGERRVKDIMRPRIDIDAVDADTPFEEIAGAVAMSGFSRLPVYEGDLDHILGFVYSKDVFQLYFMRREIDVRKILHPPLFVPRSLPLDRLLTMFQAQKTQLAVVLDEFGGTEGIVTFEDVLEELVGEIHDEHRHDRAQHVVRRDDSSWLVDGRVPVHDFIEHLPEPLRGIPIPADVSTVSGIVLSHLERLPKIGDAVTIGPLRLEVVDMDGTRIDRLLVSQEAPQNTGDARTGVSGGAAP